MPYRDGDDARRVHLRLVENLTVATPCRERWDRMHGDERVRHCARCSKDVHNLSAMSLEEIAALVERLQGNLCARFYRRPDGRFVTDDCPGTDTARLASRIAGGAVAAIGVAAAAALIATAPSSGPEPDEHESLEDPAEYVPVAVLDTDADERSLEQMSDLVMVQGLMSFGRDGTEGTVGTIAQDARAESIKSLLAASGEPSAEPPMTFDKQCSRFNPAGSFEDFEIEAGSIAPPSYPPGSFGWGPRRTDWYARPCPIKPAHEPRAALDDEMESASD